MPHRVAEMVEEWNREAGQPLDYPAIHEQIEYLADKQYSEYVPTVGPYPDFRLRFRDWLMKATNEEDRKLLFRLVPHIFFIGRREFASLYRAALRGPIHRWLVDLLDLQLHDPRLGKRLSEEIRRTWFCPITDSMPIAEFYHANRLSGVDLRPDWRSVRTIGCREKLSAHMQEKGFVRVVLLEDFIASGEQAKEALVFAASLSPAVQVLAVPLVVCPAGAAMGEALSKTHNNLSFHPVLELPQGIFISPNATPDEPAFFGQVRDLVQRLHPLVRGRNRSLKPFGYKNTGALTVMYTNCPNNTLPVVHNDSESWSSLFPRSRRL